jgi:hypothetical protein
VVVAVVVAAATVVAAAVVAVATVVAAAVAAATVVAAAAAVAKNGIAATVMAVAAAAVTAGNPCTQHPFKFMAGLPHGVPLFYGHLDSIEGTPTPPEATLSLSDSTKSGSPHLKLAV